MKKIKILYLIGTLDVGGAERHLVEVVRRLDRTAFRPSVCTLSPGGALAAEVEAAGVPVRVVDFRGLLRNPLRGPAVVDRISVLIRFMRREKFDIVHGYLFHAYILAAFAGRMAGVPRIVASRRSLSFFKKGKPHYFFAERLANRWTDVIIPNSEAVRRDVLKHENVRPDKIVVIPNGIDADAYAAANDGGRVRREFGIPGESAVVGVVANLIHYKGHLDFLEAAALVKAERPSTIFLFIGEGPMRPALERRVADLGLRGSVILAGQRRDMADVLAAFDISALPSHEEGFSNTILESMAAGKPVVATSVGGNLEAVEDGVTGYLVAPRDPGAMARALLDLLKNMDRGRAMGRSGRERVRREFGLEGMIGRMESVYRGLTAGRA